MADGRCEFRNDRREGLRGNHRCAFHVDTTDGDAVNGAHMSPHKQIWPHDVRRASTCLNDRDVDDVFGDEPYLQFVAPDVLAYDQIVRAMISSLRRTACHGAGL